MYTPVFKGQRSTSGVIFLGVVHFTFQTESLAWSLPNRLGCLSRRPAYLCFFNTKIATVHHQTQLFKSVGSGTELRSLCMHLPAELTL